MFVFGVYGLSTVLFRSLQVKLFVVSINASALQRHETNSCSLANLGEMLNNSFQMHPGNAWKFPVG